MEGGILDIRIDLQGGTEVSPLLVLPLLHRWELPILRFGKIMVVYPYPFLVVITLLFSWIIFINNLYVY